MDIRFYIIGASTGYAEHLTTQATEILTQVPTVLTTPRLADSLSSLRTDIQITDMQGMLEQALHADAAVALVVSGDPGFYSFARSLYKKLSAHGTVQVIPGLSSMQVLCAKCGQSYDDAYIMSLHGRYGNLVGAVSYHKKVFTLTGGIHRVPTLCHSLTVAGLGHVSVTIGEDLGAPNERIITGTAAELSKIDCSDLAVMLIDHPNAVNCYHSLRDDAFIRGKVPMTKQEVRWNAIHLLNLQPHDIVFDIGAGTGSVSVEMAYRVKDGLVYAIERKEEGLGLIQQNRQALGSFNVVPVYGRAPEVFDQLPIPNAAFIGGSGGELPHILQWLKEHNPNIRVCVSAIALETLTSALNHMKQLQFEQIEVCQISVARGHEVAQYTMMTANNPVFLIRGGPWS